MKEKFRQFMIGRYGTDGLNQFLSMASIVLLLLSLLTRFSLFTWLGLALLILCYYRSLSRNISKRTEENYQYYTLKDRIDRKFRSLKDQWANRKIYHYYRCPKCRQKLRVPRGRGRIQISCPRCGTQFIKKELTEYVWLCCSQSGCAFGRGAEALPHRLLRAVPPHRCTAWPAGPLYPEL